MVMTSVSGHLYSLDFAAGYRNWSVCTYLSQLTIMLST